MVSGQFGDGLPQSVEALERVERRKIEARRFGGGDAARGPEDARFERLRSPETTRHVARIKHRAEAAASSRRRAKSVLALEELAPSAARS